MNLILIGGVLLGTLVASAAPLKSPAATALPAAHAEKIAVAAAEEPEQPGFMTHDAVVNPETGETIEISVIGFLD